MTCMPNTTVVNFGARQSPIAGDGVFLNNNTTNNINNIINDNND